MAKETRFSSDHASIRTKKVNHCKLFVIYNLEISLVLLLRTSRENKTLFSAGLHTNRQGIDNNWWIKASTIEPTFNNSAIALSTNSLC